jgi:hypothetical protein
MAQLDLSFLPLVGVNQLMDAVAIIDEHDPIVLDTVDQMHLVALKRCCINSTHPTVLPNKTCRQSWKEQVMPLAGGRHPHAGPYVVNNLREHGEIALLPTGLTPSQGRAEDYQNVVFAVVKSVSSLRGIQDVCRCHRHKEVFCHWWALSEIAAGGRHLRKEQGNAWWLNS